MDIKGLLFNKYPFIIREIIDLYTCNIIVKLICSLKGIKHGKNIQFYGKTYFFRKPGSKITLGDNCGFRSRFNSNLIGIKQNCIISTNLPGAQIIIGNNCGFSGTVIGAFTSIILQDNVRCGANTLITDSDWHMDDPRAGKPAPILLEENVWLGEGVKVLKGVTIGKNSVIGAGSIVTKDIPANVIAAGNPCKVLKELLQKLE